MKNVIASKTLWFNILALVTAVSSEVGYTGQISGDTATYFIGIQSIVNVILRLFTNTAVIVTKSQ